MELRDRINQLAKRRGCSAYKIAKESGIPYSTFYRLMKGNSIPQFDTIERMCQGLNISLAEFFEFDDEKEQRVELDFFKDCRKMNRYQLELVRAYVKAVMAMKK